MKLRLAGRTPTEGEWAAFVSRQATGRVWAVATTGIHCRDGCPARPCLRQNLRVFDTRAMAEAAGFRPCKRCGGGLDGGRPPGAGLGA